MLFSSGSFSRYANSLELTWRIVFLLMSMELRLGGQGMTVARVEEGFAEKSVVRVEEGFGDIASDDF